MISDNYSECRSPLNDARLPSLTALRCFEVAARLENFTRAADELHLTHGAVSRAVRALEDELGLALFERRSRRVFLTAAGQKLAAAVRDGFDLIKQASRDLRVTARQQRQWVLSCEPTLLMRWLIPRWPEFQFRYPDINLHLVAGGGPFSFAAGIDLAIRRDDFPWPPGIHVAPLFAEKVGPVCRPDKAMHWFSQNQGMLTLSLQAPRLDSRTRPSAWQEWSSAANQAAPETPVHYFEHFYFSLQAAVAGLGVAIGPWHLVRDDLESGVLAAPMGFVKDGSSYCLLSPHALLPDSPQAHLLNWLRSVA